MIGWAMAFAAKSVMASPTTEATAPRNSAAAPTYRVSTPDLATPTVPTTSTPRRGTPVPSIQAKVNRPPTPGATVSSAGRAASVRAVMGRRTRSEIR